MYDSSRLVAEVRQASKTYRTGDTTIDRNHAQHVDPAERNKRMMDYRQQRYQPAKR